MGQVFQGFQFVDCRVCRCLQVVDLQIDLPKSSCIWVPNQPVKGFGRGCLMTKMELARGPTNMIVMWHDGTNEYSIKN